MTMLTFASVIAIVASCADGSRTCYIEEPTSWDDEQIYVVACEFRRKTGGINNPGKILRSYEDARLKLEMIKCQDEWV